MRLTVAGELPADRTSEVYTSEEMLLTSPDDVVRTVKVQLYFPDGGGTLVGEERRLTVYEGETVAQAVVKALTERPLDSYADLYPLLPGGLYGPERQHGGGDMLPEPAGERGGAAAGGRGGAEPHDTGAGGLAVLTGGCDAGAADAGR